MKILYFIYLLFFIIFFLYFLNHFLGKKEDFKNNEKNKCAFAIPIHPKHYEYGKKIVQELSNNDCDADLYFIFTNETDKNNFKYFDTKTKSILLTDYLNDDQLKIVEKNRSWVSIKKLIALHVLNEDYDYITCIDSEILFLKNNNFYEMMKNTYDQKKILGTFVNRDGEINIIKTSAITKNNEDQDEIKKMTKDYTIYTWWNNIPVYKSTDIDHFFDFIGFDVNQLDDFLNKIDFFYFENLSYNYYCLLKNNFEIILDQSIHISLEYANSKIIENINEHVLKVYWVPNKAYKQNNDYYKNNDFYIVYHLDIDR